MTPLANKAILEDYQRLFFAISSDGPSNLPIASERSEVIFSLVKSGSTLRDYAFTDMPCSLLSGCN